MKNFNRTFNITRRFFLGVTVGFALLMPSCTIGLGAAVDIERPTAKIEESFTNYTVKGAFTVSGTCYDDQGVTDLLITVRSSDSDKFSKVYRYSELAEGDDTIQIIRNQQEVLETDKDGRETLVTKDILDPKLHRRIDKWSIKLNEKKDGKNPLPDGKYVISVKAIDDNNSTERAIEKLTSVECSFTVDNTAPLLVLSRPGLGETGTGDLYGRTFNISGRVADDGNIEKMEIEIHNADVDLSENPEAEPLCVIPLSNLAPSIDINAAIADQEQDDENGNKIDFYKKIYGINQNVKIEDSELTTKRYQCRIRVYDDARFYPAVANDKGNCSSTFFLDSDAKIKELADYYTISDLYHILNETYSSSSRAASGNAAVDQVKEWLLNREEEESDSHKLAYFFLNPENSPKYTLQGGYSPLTEDFNSFRNITVSDGETLSVKIDPGCDDISLVKNTLGVYVVKTIADGDTTWKVDPTEEEIALVPSLIDENGQTVNLTAEEKNARESAFETQGTSYIISVKIGKDYGIRAGNSYKIVVKGKDKYNKINNGSKEYGFFFTAKGSAPTLNLEKAEDGTDKFKTIEYSNAARLQNLTISGEAYHAEETPEVKLFIYKDDANILGTGEEEPHFTPELSSDGKFTLKLKDYITDTTHNAEYRIKMYAEVSGNNKSGEIDKTLVYDITAPEIEVSSITPVVEQEENGVTKKYVNGKIKIKVSFQDKHSAVDVDTIDYSYPLSAGVYKSYLADIKKAGERTPQNNWEITLDTTTLEDEKDLDFEFTVKDKAGNETVLPLAYKIGSTDTNYKVSQATDIPVISLTGISENVAENQITKDKNSIVQGTRLNGYVYDDDGLSEVTVTCKSCETDTLVINEKKTLEDKDLKGVTDEKYLLSQVLPSIKGNYKLVITTKDIYGKSYTYTTFIKIKGAAPEIVSLAYDTSTITATGNGKKSLKVTGKVIGERDTVSAGASAAEKLKANLKIWVSNDNGSTWRTVPAWQAGTTFENNIETVWECDLSDSTKYPDLLKTDEGPHTLYFKAEDGNEVTSSVKSLTYKIDNAKPVVESIKRTNGNEIGDYITISPFQFAPKTNDSGSEVAYFWQVSKAESVPAAVTSYSDFLNESKGWKKAAAGKTFSFGFEEVTGEGKYTVYVHAVDAAENFSDLKSQTFIADKTKPKANFKNATVEYTKVPVVLDYETSDAVSGVKTIEIKQVPPSGSDNSKTFKFDSENNKWVYQKQGQPDEVTTVFPAGAALEQGTYTFEISALDKAGLLSEKTDASRYSFIYDTVSPQTELEVSEMMKINYGTELSPDWKADVVNGKITIKGNTDDDTSKVKSVTLKVFSGTDTSAAGTVLYSLTTDGDEFKNGITVSGSQVITADSGNTKDSFTFVLDTTKLSDTSTYSIVLDAADNAGNAAVQNVTEIYVDQSTDVPTLKIQEPADTSINSKTNVNKNKNGKNLFGASGEKINLTAQDDDGSPTVTIICYKEDGTKVEEKTLTDENISYTLPETEGFYRIKASVKDKYGIAGTSDSVYDFWVGITSGAPYVEIENNNKVYVKGTSAETAEGVTLNIKYRGGTILERKVSVEGNESSAVTVDNSSADWGAPANTTAEQTYNDTVKAFCAAGTSKKVTVTYTARNQFNEDCTASYIYLIDNQAPVFKTDSFTVNNETANGNKWYKTTGFRISGVWTDSGYNETAVDGYTHSSEVYKVRHWITTTSTAPAANVSDSGTFNVTADSVNKEFKLTDKVINGCVEGNNWVWFKAVDKAGNESDFVSVRLRIDTTAPKLSLNQEKTIYVQSVDGYKVTGTLVDENVSSNDEVNKSCGLSTTGAVKVYQGTKEGTLLATLASVNADGSFEVSLPETNFTGSAPYTITVYGYDANGNESSNKSFTLDVDTEVPEVVVNGPVGRKGKQSLGEAENPVTVFGLVHDNKSGVKAVYYQILADEAEAPTNTSSGWLTADGISNWSKKETTERAKGKYKLYTYAEDNAGNKSTVAEGTPFDIDYEVPEITVKVNGTADNSTAEIVQTGDKFTFEATATDDWGTPALVVTMDGTEISGLKEVTADGIYEFVATATDNVGKVTKVTRKIRLDKTAPVLEVTSPDLTSWQTSTSVNVKGSAIDATSKVSKVYWTTTKTTPAVGSGNNGTFTGWTEATGTSSWNFTLSGLTTDTDSKKFRLAAVDECGNFVVTEKTVKVDTTAPEVSIKATDVSGTAKENNGTANVIEINNNVEFTVKDTFLDTTPYTITVTAPDGNDLSSGYTVTAKDGNTATSKTFTLAVASPVQGLYTVTVNGKDSAGHTVPVSVKLNYDTEAPSISVQNLEDNQWLTEASYDVKGITTDATGTSKVYWTTTAATPAVGTGNKGTFTGWNTATDSWKASLTNLTNTNGTALKIAAVDTLGNYRVIEKTLKVDLKNPDVSLYTDSGCENALTGTPETNDAYTFYIKVSDKVSDAVAGSGIKSVTVNDAAATVVNATTGVYSYTQAKTAGNYTYKILVTDNAGRESQASASLIIDTTKPEVSDWTPSLTVLENGVNYVNGTIDLSFTIKDERKLASKFSYKIVDESNNEKVAATNVSLTNIANETVTLSIDTTKLTDKKDNTVTVTAEDAAGNTEDFTYDLYVDQDTDCPYYETTSDVSLFGMSVWTINGKVKDDDGIKLVQVKIDDGDYVTKYDATKDAEGNTIENPVYSTERTFNYVIDGDNITEGAHKLTVLVTDKNEKTNATVHKAVVNFNVDKAAPTVVPYKVNGSDYTSGMFVRKDFDIYLDANDANGVTSVKLIKVNDTAVTPVTLSKGTAEGYTNYYLDALTDQTNGNGKTRTYRVTDTYGRTADTTIRYNVDTVNPSVTATLFEYSAGNRTVAYDSSAEGTNKWKVTETGKTAVYAASVSDVWFSTSSVSITSKDAVSDLNLVRGVTATVGGVDSDFNMVVADKDSTKKGSFAVSQALANGSVVPVVLTFKDEAGNTYTHTVNFKVDDVKPELSEIKLKKGSSEVTSLNKADITNIATDKVTVSVKISDATSLVSDSTVKLYDGTRVVKNAAGTADLTATASSGTYTFEIPDSALTDGNHTFKVVASDNAGNEESSESVTCAVDQKLPKVTYVSPANNTSNINKLITISGEIDEENIPENFSPKLYVYKATEWKELSSYTASLSGNTWTFTNVDTEGTNFTDKAENRLKVVYTDKVGNESADELKLNINQSADIPVITLDSINTDNSSKTNSGVISGKISDDDANTVSGVSKQVRKLEVLVLQADNTAAEIKDKTVDSDGWVEITPDAEAWSFEIKDPSDQKYTMKFRVTDWASNTPNFTTGEGSAPYIKYGNQTSVITAVEFEYDKEPPLVTRIYGKLDTDEAFALLTGRNNFGGPNQTTLTIKVFAWDKIFGADLSAKMTVGTADAGYMVKADDAVSTEFTIDSKTVTKQAAVFTKDITLADATSGVIPVLVTVTDGAGGSETVSVTVTIDNIAPEIISNFTPKTTDEVSNTVNVTGTVSDDETSDTGVVKIDYYLPPHSVGSVSPKNPSGVAESNWSSSNPPEGETSKISLSSAVFSLTLDNLVDYVGDQAKTELKSNYEDYETGTDTGVYDIPVWFRLTDAVGNVGYYTDYFVHFNPNADKPRVSVSALADDIQTNVKIENEGAAAYFLDYYILGGEIVIRGTAEDDEGIDAVYVQYDIDGDGDFDDTDKAWLTSKGYTVENIPATGTPAAWGIKASGKGQWTARFDATPYNNDATALAKVQIKDENSKKTGGTLGIRVRAVDLATLSSGDPNNQYASSWSPVQHVSINTLSPAFSGSVYVQQYTNSNYTIAVAGTRKEYTPGMYISGTNWRVEGSVSKANGKINDVEVSGSTSGSLSANASWFNKVNDPSNADIELRTEYMIPISTSTTSFSIDIEAGDNATPQNRSKTKIELYIDNAAPTFETESNKLVVYKNGYAGTYPKLNDSTVLLQNSNGGTTLAGRVTDSQSGFEKMFVFAERKGKDDVNRVYNLMEACGADRTANRTDLGVAKDGITVSIDTTTGSITKGLPVFTATVVKNSDNTKFTYAAGKTNKNLRAGGYVVINNRFYKIQSKIETSGLFTLTEPVEEAYTTATFVYAMCIDNTNENSRSDGTIDNDDGDGMVEGYRQTGSNYIWNMEFDSSHIPDGPIELHFVVYDAAGNHGDSSIETRVSNNAPRITHVRLGTDLNLNGTIAASEYTDFYAYKNSYGDADLTKGLEVWNLVPSEETESIGRDWTIKDGLNVIPEFVGGTAPFYWVFSKEEGIGSGKRITSAEAEVDTENQKINNKGLIELDNDAIGEDGEFTDSNDGMNTYRFSFWDSTEDSDPGVDSGSCVLNVELKQDLVDNISPVVYVHPFFWEKAGADEDDQKFNSLQWYGKTPLGHIELEADLTDAIKNAKYDTTHTLGADPKVSGKIIIRGTAYDETKLTAIRVRYDGIITTDTACVATYKSDASGWNDGGNATNGYVLKVKDKNGGVTQKGHLVEWALELDTSKISGQVGVNKLVKVQAADKTGTYSTIASGTATSTVNETVYSSKKLAERGLYWTTKDAAKTALAADSQTGAVEMFDHIIELQGTSEAEAGTGVYAYKAYGTVAQYQMDIVPYVTEVVTSLTKLKTTNGSVFNRSALGHYPVQSVVDTTRAAQQNDTSSETITLKGFNLAGTVVVTDGTKLEGSETFVSGSDITFTPASLPTSTAVSGTSYSNFTATVGGIPLMNNLNNNNASGNSGIEISDSETDYDTLKDYAYNRVPNKENNNKLTDDIWFDVWEFNDRVAKAADEGIMYSAQMKVNPANNLIQYAYVTSNKMLYMGTPGNSAKSSTYTARRDYAGNPDYILPMSVGFHINEAGTKTYASLLAAEDIDCYRLFVDGSYKNDMDTVYGVTNNLKDQMYSPVFASIGDNLYHAYYDKLHNDIRFLTNTQITTSKNRDTSSNCQIIAGGASKATRGAGQYVSLAGVIGKDASNNNIDVICAVWFNQSATKLQYSYKENAAGSSTTKTGDEASPSGWSDPIDVFTGGGDHCQIVSDANGGIHIAAYVGGSLKYVYFPAYNTYTAATYDEETYACTVDSGSVGNHLSLDVALVNVTPESETATYRPMPVMAYYSGRQKPKYAKLVLDSWHTTDSDGNDTVTALADWIAPDGFADNKFTGKWECNYVPTRTNLIMVQEDKINVGLWKSITTDTKGQIKNSVTGTSTYVNTATNNCNSSTYGNGTSNGVLLYLTDGGLNMESAQMR